MVKMKRGSAAYQSGKAFEESVKDSVEYIENLYGTPVLAWRILDSSSYGSRRKYNQESLCDHIMIWNGVSVFIEAKTSKGAASFESRYIRPNQLESMLSIERAGGRAYFVFGKKNRAFEVERVFAVKASAVARLMETPSITWAKLAESGVEIFKYPRLRKNHKDRWNLEPLWN